MKGCSWEDIDPATIQNLESYFELDYPTYEIIFCVKDSNDPFIPEIQRLITAYPDVTARLLVAGPDIGSNPKLNNLNQELGSNFYSKINFV